MKKPRVFLILLAVAQLTCNQAIMTAPSGSTLTLFANPMFIASNGGVSVISALVIEPSGQPVADGTVVQFFTTLGIIVEQAKTNDGVARVNLRANGRSGEANITAVSGGDGGLPGPSPSPTAPPTTTASATGPITGASVPQGAAVDTETVTIGNPNAARVVVTANPPRITISRSSQITATVFDNAGNPVPGVPVFFSVTEGANSSFIEDSGPHFTDSNGQAFAVLRTRSLVSGSATVQAQVPSTGGFATGTVVVPIFPEG